MKIRMKGPKGEIEFEAEISFTWVMKKDYPDGWDRVGREARLHEVIEQLVILYNGLERDE